MPSALGATPGISPMVVGLTVVALGSSSPEIALGWDGRIDSAPFALH